LTRAAPTIVPVRANGRGAADSADSRSRFTLDWKVIAIVMLFLTVLLLAWQVVSDLRRTPVGGTSQPVAQIETVEAAADEAVAPVPADLGGGAGQVGGVVPESAEPDPIQRIETDVRQAGLRPKVILLAADAQPLPTWTPTPSPTPAPTATPAPSPTAQASTLLQTAGFSEPRWINVDLTNQLLTAYEFDTPVYSTYITSGNWDTPTVTGQFRIYQQLQSQNMSGYHLGYDYYLPNVPYVQYFYGDFALHGAYWRDTFGTPGSHGCVNLPLPAAEWLYQFADIGTLVNVHY
jgi:lipoprotein-anchoring transpeptidase ErfK/SrfK